MTKEYTNALPEDIAKEICSTLGVLASDIAEKGVQVSFVANNKTGIQAYRVLSHSYQGCFNLRWCFLRHGDIKKVNKTQGF